MSFRRMLPFLFLNIVISLTVVLGVLYWWEYGRESEEPPGDPFVVVVPTETATVSSFIDNTPIPPPTEEDDGTETYIVVAGDTLGAISALFDVPIDDIRQANALESDFIQVGQQLIIPINGLPTATPTPIPTETPNVAPTPIPTEPLAQGEAIIEIREVIAPGLLTEEAVSIVNVGSRQIALQNWTLRDQEGHIYTFGQITLFGDGAGIVVHTEAGQSSNIDLYWGLEEPIWELGDLVTLLDAEGTEQATYRVEGAGPDE